MASLVLRIALMTVVLVTATADANEPAIVSCEAKDVFPLSQCSSMTEKVEISSELGVGEDADFSNSSSIIVDVLGPNENGDLETATIKALNGLSGARGFRLDRDENDQLIVVAEEQKASFLKKRDAVIIVKKDSGTSSVEVDVSSEVEGVDAGSAIVVADALDSIVIRASGYNGADGIAATEKLAEDAAVGAGLVPDQLAAAYRQRRAEEPGTQLAFDGDDLNNYEASGLSCDSSETAVGVGGSYAFDNAGLRGPYKNKTPDDVPEGIDVVALVQEEAKRSFCQRKPEFSLSQECEAEAEYSFRAVCRIQPENRSLKVFKRDPVRWERAICAPSTETKIRRKIVRQAFVQITVPGGKSFSGIISRDISFAATKDVLRKRLAQDDELIAELEGSEQSPESGLVWFNPFWTQAAAIGVNELIEVSGSITVNNGYNADGFPPLDASSVSQRQGSKLLFIPRKNDKTPCADLGGDGGCFLGSTDLFGFEGDQTDWAAKDATIEGSNMFGCAPLIDLGSDPLYSTAKVIGSGPREEEKFDDYLRYFKAFDASSIGFSVEDLKAASLIKVSQCFAFEVLEAVVNGNLVKGPWNRVAGQVEPSVLERDPNTDSNEACTDAFPERIGLETFIQYEREDTCYVDDPRYPPSFLAKKLGLSGVTTQQEIEVDQLSGKWNRSDSEPLDPGSVGISDPTKIITNSVYEISFPESVSEADKDRLGTIAGAAERKNYCVHIIDPLEQDATSRSYWHRDTNPGGWPVATRSIELASFSFRQGEKVATPSEAGNRRSCPEGIRLDRYLGNIPRPTCPVDYDEQSGEITNGSSTKLRLSSWSAAFGADRWQTHDEQSDVDTPQNYTLRSTILNTRYDDLPTQVFTAKTHEVHPELFVEASGESPSFTGEQFPPSYGFLKEADEGPARRIFPGWTRQSSLISRSGASVGPETFTPFDGDTLSQRTAAWCNAEAFSQLASGGLGQGFGARGLLRDAPKRVFVFTLSEYDEQTEGLIEKKPYVGIEITGIGSGGFYTDSPYPALGAKEASDSITEQDFLSARYPFLGARFVESCEPGNVYDNFLGICRPSLVETPTIDPATCVDPSEFSNPYTNQCTKVQQIWFAQSRTTEIIDHARDRAPWSLLLSKQVLKDEDTSKPFDYPFNLFGGGEQRGPEDTLTGNTFEELIQVGFLRSLNLMVEQDDRSVFLNRPEALNKMILAPGFASALSPQASACNVSTKILAVPADKAESGIDRDNSLPEGAMIVSFDTICDEQDGFRISASARMMGDDGLRVNTIAAARASLRVEQNPGDGFERISVDLNNAANRTVFRLSDIHDTLISGLSATTGSEELLAVEIEPPTVRSRASEWEQSGRAARYGPWRSRIKTEPTPTTTDTAASAFVCAVRQQDGSVAIEGQITGPGGELVSVGVKSGVWTAAGLDSPKVTNGGALCDTDESNCALSDEELSLFTNTVINSETRLITRSSVTQWTPWSFELPTDAPKDLDQQSVSPFGSWTEIGSLQPGASVPSCEMYNSSGAEDEQLSRLVFDDVVNKIPDLEIDGQFSVYRIAHPLDLEKDFMVVPFDAEQRLSKSCVRWDSVRGDRCEQSMPTIEGPDLAPLVFGGEWEQVFVERKERLSQECSLFGYSEEVSLVNGDPVGPVDASRCQRGSRCVAAQGAPIVTDQLGVEGRQAYNADGSCYAGQDNGSGGVIADTAAIDQGEYLRPLRDPRVEFCTPDTCPFQVNTQTFQVDASVPVSGEPGEDGTGAGGAIVFCRDCPSIDFSGSAGRGGAGSNPVSSDRSKTLTCVKSNNNPLNPIFSVRHLWSQPFVGGSAGQNGRSGREGEGLRVYKDLSPEAIWQLSQPDFWRTPEQQQDSD